MHPQDKELCLIKLYVDVDDLLISYRQWQKTQQLLPQSTRHKTRTKALNEAEMATILVFYHMSGYKNFKYYYEDFILHNGKDYFPNAPQYHSFLPYILWVLPLLALWVMWTCKNSIQTGYYYIDSKKLPVCHLKREHQHKVFKDLARKGKSSMGWFYGFKVHFVINHLGQIVNFCFTPGNTADNNHSVLRSLLKDLRGKCCGDKGYQTQLFSLFQEQGLHLLVKPRHNMQSSALVNLPDVHFMKKRGVIESVNDILISVCDLEHTRHRKPEHAFAHMISSLIAYQYLPQKPHIYIKGAINYQDMN